MLVQLINKMNQRAKKHKTPPTHTTMREDHFRRQREELCRQLRHQQYFTGYRSQCE